MSALFPHCASDRLVVVRVDLRLAIPDERAPVDFGCRGCKAEVNYRHLDYHRAGSWYVPPRRRWTRDRLRLWRKPFRHGISEGYLRGCRCWGCTYCYVVSTVCQQRRRQLCGYDR